MSGDPYWYDNVKLLLPMTGSNNSTTFTDLERVPKTVTRYGGTKIVTAQADPFGNSNGVAYFDGNGTYLTVPDSSDVNFGSGAFEIELWCYRTTHPSDNIDMLVHQLNGSGFNFEWATNGSLGMFLHGQPTSYRNNGLFLLSQFNHVVLNRSNGIFRGFLNGVMQFSNTDSRALGGGVLYIGRDAAVPSRDFGPGYMSNVRITKGVVRYTDNFTPPDAPFPDYNTQLSGTVSETLAADTFVAEAYQASDGVLSGRKVFTGTSFTVDIKTPEKAHYLTVKPNMGAAWKSSTVYALNGKVFPTDPITKPYYYTATVAGTSGSTEPTWPATPGQTVTDGTITWECVERMVQPITHGPLIPS